MTADLFNLGRVRRELGGQADAILAAQPTDPPTKNSFWVAERFLAGAYPLDDLAELTAAGVRSYYNLTEPGELSIQGRLIPYALPLRRACPQAKHHRLAIRDNSVPSPSTLRALLDSLDRDLAAGRTVYLHCRGGVGRTGTAVACWLIQQGLDANEALGLLGELRQQDTTRRWRKAPASLEQEWFVHDFAHLEAVRRAVA